MFRRHRSGGISVFGYGGRIKVDNTLDERLRLLEQQVRVFQIKVQHGRQAYRHCLKTSTDAAGAARDVVRQERCVLVCLILDLRVSGLTFCIHFYREPQALHVDVLLYLASRHLDGV